MTRTKTVYGLTTIELDRKMNSEIEKIETIETENGKIKSVSIAASGENRNVQLYGTILYETTTNHMAPR